MKRSIPTLTLVIAAILFGNTLASKSFAQEYTKKTEWQTLFNGKDLKNWDIVIGHGGPTRVNEDPDKLFQVHDGMVHTYRDTEDGS